MMRGVRPRERGGHHDPGPAPRGERALVRGGVDPVGAARHDAEPRRRPFADLDGSGIGATHAGAEQLTDRKTYAALLAATERGAEGLSTQRGGSRSSGGGFASLLSQAAEIYEETARIIYGQPVPRGQSYSAIL